MSSKAVLRISNSAGLGSSSGVNRSSASVMKMPEAMTVISFFRSRKCSSAWAWVR